MLHYHGTPITPREELYKLEGRCFCVSFAEPRDIDVCHAIGQSVMLDNGAFTFWRTGRRPNWEEYYAWADPWLDYPTTWAVIPDVIDGDEYENDELLAEWPLRKGVPVWHLHESLERLERLVRDYRFVCFGSSGTYRTPGSPEWHERVIEAFDTLADERGRVPPIHMLRGLAFAGGSYPFASADSTNVARNFKGSHRQRPEPIALMAARIDAKQCPGRWETGTRIIEMEVA